MEKNNLPTDFHIKEITENKRRLIDLLLIGDESERMIDRYIGRGRLFAGYCGEDAVGVCLTADKGRGVIEIKNLAVVPEFRHRGIARAMINHVEMSNQGKTLILGTGESPYNLNFYRGLGFVYSHRVADFFTENYPEEIVEDGVVLRDMIYLKKQL